jgi:succinate-semialdehyde dehydrogenase/glutarate-semialdehyde dehydrogenase
MPSADLEAAIERGVAARMQNVGQSCIAAKRFIVSDRIYDRFVSGFVERMRALKVGDPMDEATEVGPLATEAILRGVDEQVKASVSAGAKLLTGGKRIERAGFFYEPTVLAEIPENARAYREEIFGPVASFFRAADAAEAIQIANDSPFGLGASAWTNDATEKQLFASELEAGMVFINRMVASDPRLPFGGAKRSGFGRELAEEGIREFVNIKTVSVA